MPGSGRFGCGGWGRYMDMIASFSPHSFLEMGKQRPKRVEFCLAACQLCDLEEVTHTSVSQFPIYDLG